jgi:DNA-binding NarL/FixJ family response regulator
MQSRLLASALQRRPEFRISICAVDSESIVKAIPLTHARVVLHAVNPALAVDMQMAAIRQVHLSNPGTAKILLSESYNRELVIAAFRSGARGIFCVANTHLRLLCRCIQRVAEGQVWANSEQLDFLLDLVSEVPLLHVADARGRPLLTPREEQVVALVAEGLSNRDVARELELSVHTVKKYLFRIFDKLGVSSRVELVIHAVNHCNPRNAAWLAGLNRAAPRA